MEGRHRIPLALVGVLSLLAGGAAVLGVVQGRTNANDVVRNATDATYGKPLGGQSLTLNLTIAVSAGTGAGVLSQVRQIVYTAPSSMVVSQTKPSRKFLGKVPAAGINDALARYAAVSAGSGTWVQHGSTFLRTESLRDFSSRVRPISTVTGKVYERATLRDGYLVSLALRVVVPQQNLPDGKQAPGGVVGESYTLVTVDGQKP